MTATNQSFTMKSGNSKHIVITVEDSDGRLLDLTGVDIKWELKRDVRTPSPFLTKSMLNGIVMNDPKSGKFTIRLEPEDTKDLYGSTYHSVKIVDASGNVSTITEGIINIER